MTEMRPARMPKILVVDDEATILQTLRFNLERNGYAVCTAGDGRQALQLTNRLGQGERLVERGPLIGIAAAGTQKSQHRQRRNPSPRGGSGIRQ